MNTDDMDIMSAFMEWYEGLPYVGRTDLPSREQVLSELTDAVLNALPTDWSLEFKESMVTFRHNDGCELCFSVYPSSYGILHYARLGRGQAAVDVSGGPAVPDYRPCIRKDRVSSGRRLT